MHTNKCTNKQQDGGGNLTTSPIKDVTNVEADENTSTNGFDDPLLLRCFKLACREIYVLFVLMMP